MKTRVLIIFSLTATLLIAGTLWLRAEPVTVPPTLGPFVVNPTVILINTPTAVTATIRITEPSVIANGLNLLRRNSNGTQTILGVMRDDGLIGDAVANDKTFTLQVTLTESTADQFQLQASAAFKAELQRVFSPPITITKMASASWSDSSIGISSLSYPAGWFWKADQHGATFANVEQQSQHISDQAFASESNFAIRIIKDSNPEMLPIDSWFAMHFANGFSSDVIDKHLTIVSEVSAVQIQLSEIGRRVHIYIPHGKDVIEIIYGLYAPSFIGAYEAIVRSIRF